MAFKNSDIYSLCRYIINKESRSGYMNIDDFNLNSKMANVVLLKEKLGLSNDYNLGVPISRRQKGLSTIADDQVIQFKKKQNISFSSGIGSLPNDYFRYESARVSGAYEPVEMLNSAELSRRLNNAIDTPDTYFPAAEIIGSSMYIYPTAITTATLIFYRYPVTPVTDFYIDANGEVIILEEGATHLLASGETGSAGQTAGTTVTSLTIEHEWSADCAIEMAWIILKNMGVNTSRADVFQVADKIQKEGA